MKNIKALSCNVSRRPGGQCRVNAVLIQLLVHSARLCGTTVLVHARIARMVLPFCLARHAMGLFVTLVASWYIFVAHPYMYVQSSLNLYMYISEFTVMYMLHGYLLPHVKYCCDSHSEQWQPT